MTVKYEVREVVGEGLSLSTAKMGKTIMYAVYNGDRRVWSDDCYFADQLVGRARSAAKARAAKKRNAYQSYFDRTGKCWEVEQDVKEGKDLFEKETKELVFRTERELAPRVFSLLRTGGLNKSAKDELLKAASTIVVDTIEKRRKDGYVTRYRKIDAYCFASSVSLTAAVVKNFVF